MRTQKEKQEEKESSRNNIEKRKSATELCRCDMKLAYTMNGTDNVTVTFIHAFNLKVKRQCIWCFIVQEFSGRAVWEYTSKMSCASKKSFLIFSAWENPFVHEFYLTRKSHTCINNPFAIWVCLCALYLCPSNQTVHIFIVTTHGKQFLRKIK